MRQRRSWRPLGSRSDEGGQHGCGASSPARGSNRDRPRFRRHRDRRRRCRALPALQAARARLCGCGPSRPAAGSAAPGTGTAIRARASIPKAGPTATRSRRSCSRSGTGKSTSRRSPRPSAISTMSPTNSTCAATSSSTAASPRRTTARRRAAGSSRWRDGGRYSTRFLVTAIGILSAPTMPNIPGIDTLQGPVLPHPSLAQGRRRFRRQAGRHHRHRRNRGADDPGDRQDGRSPDRVPAHPELVRAAAQRQDLRRGDARHPRPLSRNPGALPRRRRAATSTPRTRARRSR